MKILTELIKENVRKFKVKISFCGGVDINCFVSAQVCFTVRSSFYFFSSQRERKIKEGGHGVDLLAA